MKRTFLIAVLSAPILIAGAAAAQQVSPPALIRVQAGGEEPDAERMELAGQIMNSVDVEQVTIRALDSSMEQMLSTGQYASMSKEDRDIMIAAVRAAIIDLIPEIKEETRRQYATIFTAEELRGILEFYQTPAGKGLLSKADQLAAANGLMMNNLIPKLQVAMVRHLCEHYDCGEDGAPAVGTGDSHRPGAHK